MAYQEPPRMLGKRDKHHMAKPVFVSAEDGSGKAAYDPVLAQSLSAARVAHQAVESYIEARKELDAAEEDAGVEVYKSKSQPDVIIGLESYKKQPSSTNASGITIRPRRPSVARRLSHMISRARSAPVPQGSDPPRYWDVLDCGTKYNRMPEVGDAFYTLPMAFDAPFEGETLWDNGGLDVTSARKISGFYVTATVDVAGVKGHNKLVHLTFTAKRRGAEIWAFHGIERHEIKSSVINSSVPARLKPHNEKRMPEGVVDVVLTADRGFYFKATRKGQKADLDVVVPATTPIPRATSWNQERSDYKEPLLESLAANAVGFHSRNLRMRMVDKPQTPLAFGIRSLDWMRNTKNEWLAKVQKPLNVIGGQPSVLNNVEGLYKDWKPPSRRLSEFMYR